MGFTVNFTDNQNVTASDLSGVSKSIDTGSQGTEFKDNTLYGVDELNRISASLITKGVSSGLNVSLNGETVNISAGVAFFGDGKKIIVDTDGINLKCAENTKQYVWLSNDTVSATVSAKCTEEVPDGDYVLLAQISAAGKVVANKDIALMKNSSLLPNCYERITQHIVINTEDNGTIFSLDIGKDYRRMVFFGNLQPVYINWDENKMYQYSGSGLKETQIVNNRIKVKTGLDVEFVSYENNILSYKAYCYTQHDSVFGDLIFECM